MIARHNRGTGTMKKFAFVACFTLSLAALAPAAAQRTAPDPELTKFQAAYPSGDDLVCVVIPDEKANTSKTEAVNREGARFVVLDTKYLAGCRNPLVKSAIAKKNS